MYVIRDTMTRVLYLHQSGSRVVWGKGQKLARRFTNRCAAENAVRVYGLSGCKIVRLKPKTAKREYYVVSDLKGDGIGRIGPFESFTAADEWLLSLTVESGKP